MSHDDESRQYLVQQIEGKRRCISAFLRKMEPRSVRLTNQGIIFSAVAAAFTAAPAFGGEQFTEFMRQLVGAQSDSSIWRLLCLAAMLCSLLALISTTLHKTHNLSANLAKAHDLNSKLEGLALSVHMGMDNTKAAELFKQYTTEASFVPPDLTPVMV